MKKLLIVVCLFAIGITATYAQAQVAIGLKAGANISKVDADNVDAKSLTGFNVGAFGLIKLAKFGIQPEILFSQQGSKVDDLEFETSYITIPVMVKTYLAAGINIQVGPQFGFLNKAELEGVGDVKDGLKKSDLSVNFGLGWDLPFGLVIDARYNLGLSDINDDFSSESIKNRVIQVSVGYKIFKIGK